MWSLIIVVTVISVLLAGCVKDDCNPNDNMLYGIIETYLLDRKDQEDGPGIRWYWCEAPMREGAKIPTGRLGPIVNLTDGSDYGYGGWVRVLADDVKTLTDGLVWAGIRQHGDPKTSQDPLTWTWTAGTIFYVMKDYDLPRTELPAYDSREVAFYIAKHGNLPWDIACFTVQELRRQMDRGECKTPSAKSPVTQSGGTSGTTTGGSTTGGDWGSN